MVHDGKISLIFSNCVLLLTFVQHLFSGKQDNAVPICSDRPLEKETAITAVSVFSGFGQTLLVGAVLLIVVHPCLLVVVVLP